MALANLKTTYERTKTKIFAKGEGDAEDREYFEEKEKVLNLEQVMLRLNKRSKKSLELYAEMAKLQNELATDFNNMYTSDDRMHTNVVAVREAAINAEANRHKMAERIEANSFRPVDEYCASFREIKRRMDEYTLRRTDMERHRSELTKLQEKGATGAQKLPMAEEKYKIALQRYEEMREELMVDLPALNNDKNTIVGYMVACSLKSQAEFYSDLAAKYSVINTLVAGIDERSVLNHPRVVTPQENSAASNNLRAHPVFNKGEQRQTTQMQPVKAPTQPQPQATQPTPQPLVQPAFTLQKQPTSQHTLDQQAMYRAEYASITAMPPTAPVAETSLPPPSSTTTPTTTTPTTSYTPPVAATPPVSSGFQPVKAQGLYDFTASEDNELSFKKGDIITIIAKQHGDWWEGELNGASGLLPSNYVKEL